MASLARQFEFVQQTWIGNSKFHRLSDDVDPVSATVVPAGAVFTAPDDPVRRRLAVPEAFVRTVGGGYFFLPSRSGLRRIGGQR